MSKSIKLIPKNIGTFVFGKAVDITDPCYNHGVWCRMNDVPVVPGIYDINIFHGSRYFSDLDGNRHRDTRIFVLQIRHESIRDQIIDPKQMEEIGDIGVDAGMAGIFNSPKPDYDDEQWGNICSLFNRSDYAITNDGVISTSGYGDGGYSVFALRNKKGECVAIEIRF